MSSTGIPVHACTLLILSVPRSHLLYLSFLPSPSKRRVLLVCRFYCWEPAETSLAGSCIEQRPCILQMKLRLCYQTAPVPKQHPLAPYWRDSLSDFPRSC